MQRSGLRLMVRPETSRVSRFPNSSPVRSGSRGFSLNRGREGGHEHSLHLPRRHGAAEAAEAPAFEATEAATAAPCRIALRYAVTGLPGAATVAYLLPQHACPSAYASHWLHRALPPDPSPHAAVRRGVAA